jgi:hypothetical protein
MFRLYVIFETRGAQGHSTTSLLFLELLTEMLLYGGGGGGAHQTSLW